jgi:predicted dehydrogenase
MHKLKQAQDIKAAVVGYGAAFNMGKWHFNEMQKAGMTPTAVCELNLERLEAARKDFPGIETWQNLDEMLAHSQVNLVSIITPHNTHAAIALKCLNSGRHVVCEKPFAISTAECNAMIVAAKKNKLLLSTYHNRHWDGCILQALKTIRSGAIGAINRVEIHMSGWNQPKEWWRSSRSISGGILYDWGVHLLEYALQILDDKILEVSGFANRGVWAKKCKWGKDTNEDEAFAAIRFKSGKWASLFISNLDSKPREGWLEIAGTKGLYIFAGPFWTLITNRNGVTISRHGKNPPSESWRYYQNIADYLTKNARLFITPEWARRPIHIIDLACRSARQGRALLAEYE